MREAFTPANPDYRARVEAIFGQAPLIQHLGFRLVDVGPGWCESALDQIERRHQQQDEFVHAGVVATLADHTAGASAGSLAPADRMVLTVEFKINLLRPAVGESLRCRAQVLKPGRSITVSESEVFVVSQDREILIAKAMVTLALVDVEKGS